MIPARLPWRQEFGRKTIHLAMGVLPAWLWWAPPELRAHGLVFAFVVVLGADLLRRVWKPWKQWIDQRTQAYSRPHEQHLWVGVHAMILSAWILSWATSRELAAACMGYSVFGDAAAAMVGARRQAAHGQSMMAPTATGQATTQKTISGSAACLAVCVAIGWLLFPDRGEMIILGATAATLLERYSGPLNDNLTVPLGSACVLLLLA